MKKKLIYNIKYIYCLITLNLNKAKSSIIIVNFLVPYQFETSLIYPQKFTLNKHNQLLIKLL